MPAKGRVSVNIQTIFCLIPFMDLFAAYRVKKLRWYLLIFILAVVIPISVVEYVLFPESWETTDGDLLESFTFYYGINNTHFAFSVVTWIASILFAMYLIRYWSKQWNEQFGLT